MVMVSKRNEPSEMATEFSPGQASEAKRRPGYGNNKFQSPL